jgi:DNA-binding transcriptional LysR family regulator
VRNDPLLVALPAEHRLTTRKYLTVGDLRDEEFVAHAGGGRSVMGTLLVRLCAEAGFTPRVRHEVGETSTLVTLVAAGLGVAVVPAPTSALDVAGVAYRPLRPRTLGVDLVAAWVASPHNAIITHALKVLQELTA